MKTENNLLTKYGTWALIAGGADGLGKAFAQRFAEQGFNLVIIDINEQALTDIEQQFSETYGIEVRTICKDLSAADVVEQITSTTEDIDIGMLVYNACYCKTELFVDSSMADHLKLIDINCKTPALLSYWFGKKMIARRKGGIILVGSMGGLQGLPLISHYAASKSYQMILAEGLWDEFKPYGVDVLCSVIGQTSTPAFLKDNRDKDGGLLKIMPPEEVVDETLAQLGRQPSFIPGASNRFIAWLMRTLMSRQKAITIVGKTNRAKYG